MVPEHVHAYNYVLFKFFSFKKKFEKKKGELFKKQKKIPKLNSVNVEFFLKNSHIFPNPFSLNKFHAIQNDKKNLKIIKN